MEQPILNVDDGALDASTRGLPRPENIQKIQAEEENAEEENAEEENAEEENAEEENAEVHPQIPLPLPVPAVVLQERGEQAAVVLQERGEQAAAPDTKDTSQNLVMAHATNLQVFREYEGYHFGRYYSDSDSDVPEDYYSESEDEAQETVPHTD